MRQIIGLTVQFAAAMKEVKKSYSKKLQENQMELCPVSDVGDPAKKKDKHDNNGHLKYVSVSS